MLFVTNWVIFFFFFAEDCTVSAYVFHENTFIQILFLHKTHFSALFLFLFFFCCMRFFTSWHGAAAGEVTGPRHGEGAALSPVDGGFCRVCT